MMSNILNSKEREALKNFFNEYLLENEEFAENLNIDMYGALKKFGVNVTINEAYEDVFEEIELEGDFT